MITKDTAAKIAYAYSEIEASEALLKIIDDAKKDRSDPDFRDAFGHHQRRLRLGVPSGQSSHTLFQVDASLGEIIIKAHIEQKRAEIAALCELAKGELRNGEIGG